MRFQASSTGFSPSGAWQRDLRIVIIIPRWWATGTRRGAAPLIYLRTGVPCNRFMGIATCRLCDQELGSADLGDGDWVWPKGLEHYVLEHDVSLPDAFVEAMRAHWWLIWKGTRVRAEYRYDDFATWRAWAKARSRMTAPDSA